MKCFDRAVEINPNLAEAWLGKALLYEEQGDKENAMKCKIRAIQTGKL